MHALMQLKKFKYALIFYFSTRNYKLNNKGKLYIAYIISSLRVGCFIDPIFVIDTHILFPLSFYLIFFIVSSYISLTQVLRSAEFLGISSGI